MALMALMAVMTATTVNSEYAKCYKLFVIPDMLDTAEVKVGTGKRFDRKKVRIAEKVEPFSSRTFYLQFFLCSYRSSYPTKMADHSF